MIKKGFIALVLVGLLIVPALSVAKEHEIYTMEVWPKDNKPIVLKNFCFEHEKEGKFTSVEWRHSSITLTIADIKEIVFHSKSYRFSGSTHYSVSHDVLFRDGTKDHFKIDTGLLCGDSHYGRIKLQPHNVIKVVFLDASHGSKTTTNIFTKSDQMILKNGDIITGEVSTETFKLKTSYGELEFKAADIKTINLEGGSNNVDVITLRVGDKLSGVIQNDKIRVKMSSGATIDLDRDKVKDILFKE